MGPHGPDVNAPVAVRAELDGLPITERTDAPFSAKGEAMHACGHDVHMAALVALTHAAHALGEELPAPLLAVLQPSEEAYPSGAWELAHGPATETASGTSGAPPGIGLGTTAETARGPLAELAPAAIVAAHVHPELAWGTVALDEGAVNASCDAVEIVVEGEPTHGAYPHHGADPILALAQIVVALHAQVGRRIDPLHAATLTVGVLEGGNAENVIPAQARARAALRAHRPEDRQVLRTLVEEVAAGVAAAHGCRARVELTAGEPPLDKRPHHRRASARAAGGCRLRARPGVALVRLGRLRLLRGAGADRDGVRRPRWRPGLHAAPAASPRAAGARQRGGSRGACPGAALRGRGVVGVALDFWGASTRVNAGATVVGAGHPCPRRTLNQHAPPEVA